MDPRAELKPIKVAIVGGGCAGVTAAFELTRPEHRGRYEVTVYQLGWRLGGKGASGRGPAGRIEEHGLHIWLGYYDNAFDMMRRCYRELGRDPRTSPIADWTDAFKPDPWAGLVEKKPDGSWRRLLSNFPSLPGLPGDPYAPGEEFTVAEYLVRGARLLHQLLVSAQTSAARRGEGDSLGRDAQSLRKYGRLAGLTAMLHGAKYLESLVSLLPRMPRRRALRVLEAIAKDARAQLDPLLDADDESRDLWEIVDIMLASLTGSIRFGLVTHPEGFDAVDHYEARDWLRLCGASERALNSPFMRGLYDLAFAYEGGDRARPALSAAAGLRGSFRMFFGYRGAIVWKMQAGMGDVVFAPLYQVLARRGVRFEFFHRLDRLHLVAPEALEPGEKPFVTRLDFDVQARAPGYQPLVDVKGLPCWPAAPDWRQLLDGDHLEAEGREFESFWDRRREATRTLEVTRDFDFVVLAIGVGAIPHTCPDLVARDPRWRAMVEHLGTIATQSFQLWLRDDLESLGWDGPSANVSGFVEPFDAWADMTHLATVEDWPEPPGSIAYFCNALAFEPTPDPAAPARVRQAVRDHAIQVLSRDIGGLWPDAVNRDGTFRWESLLCADPSGERLTGPERFDTQFFTANVNPSDRYVLSLPGTAKYRISPLDDTYDNLTVAGDWTACGYDFGCVEAAVMSGRLAAHALSRLPALEEIFGYDHP